MMIPLHAVPRNGAATSLLPHDGPSAVYRHHLIIIGGGVVCRQSVCVSAARLHPGNCRQQGFAAALLCRAEFDIP